LAKSVVLSNFGLEKRRDFGKRSTDFLLLQKLGTMAESEGRFIEEINLADDDVNEVECLEDLVTLDGTDCTECTHDDMMDSSHGSQDDIVDITPPPEV
jgi:hypothetical protein